MTPELREELRVLVDDEPKVSAKAHCARVELGLVLALKEVDRLAAKGDTLLHLVNKTSSELVDRLAEIIYLKAEVGRWENETHKARMLAARSVNELQIAKRGTERLNAALRDLVEHCWLHSGYQDCGYLHMTTEQKALYDSIVRAGDVKEELET